MTPSINKALYHPVDQRQNLYDFEGENKHKVQQQATSVAGFLLKPFLHYNSETEIYTLQGRVSSLAAYVKARYKHPLGEKEPFGSEPSLMSATGFLVGKDTVLTAAHVVCENGKIDPVKVTHHAVVFNFLMKDAFQYKQKFIKNEVYMIKKVKIFSYSEKNKQWADWALVKLDREVVGRRPLALSSESIQKDLPLYMLGHPEGLPLKYTGGGTVLKTSPEGYFGCNLDAFEGNSGSPVFRRDTDEVVGILCSGHKDYTLDKNYRGKGETRCVPNRIPPLTPVHESCQRITELKEVQRYLAQRDSGFKLQKIAPPKDLQAPGLYVLGNCSSIHCFSSPKWIALGTGTFHLEKVMHLTHCGKCPSRLTILDVAIYQTEYQLKGRLIEPKSAEIEKVGQANTHLKSVLQKDTTWGYLKMTIGETSSLLSFLWIKIL